MPNPRLLKGITHGGFFIMNYESYHYALSRDMAQAAWDFIGLLFVLEGRLMDRLCIQIL